MTVAEQEHSGGHLLHVLHPGGVACGERGERFETLLGSCVAIVLTDPRRTVGAMCHIVHAMPAPAGRHRRVGRPTPSGRWQGATRGRRARVDAARGSERGPPTVGGRGAARGCRCPRAGGSSPAAP